MHNVNQQALVAALAAELKRQHVVVSPEWAAFAKTGKHRERPPANEDWWYIRSASILRVIYIQGPIGTEKLRNRYGGRKNRGVRPDAFFLAGGSHIRKILQQLEAATLIKQEAKGVHKGRVITPLGRKLIHAVAGVVKASQPKVKAAPVEKAPEAAKEVKPAEKTETPKEAEKPAVKEAPVEKPAAPKEAVPAPAKETKPEEKPAPVKEAPVEKPAKKAAPKEDPTPTAKPEAPAEEAK